MRSKTQTPQLNILAVMGSLFIISINVFGTLAWIHLYTSGRHTEWWAIAIVIICGIVAVMDGVKLWKQIHGLF